VGQKLTHRGHQARRKGRRRSRQITRRAPGADHQNCERQGPWGGSASRGESQGNQTVASRALVDSIFPWAVQVWGPPQARFARMADQLRSSEGLGGPGAASAWGRFWTQLAAGGWWWSGCAVNNISGRDWRPNSIGPVLGLGGAVLSTIPVVFFAVLWSVVAALAGDPAAAAPWPVPVRPAAAKSAAAFGSNRSCCRPGRAQAWRLSLTRPWSGKPVCAGLECRCPGFFGAAAAVPPGNAAASLMGLAMHLDRMLSC